MKLVNREGEQGPIPLRSDRFFSVENEWYFTSREGDTHGPFDTREEASDSLSLFLKHTPKHGR